MLKLHGFPTSNFYNKVKLILLEKNLEFEEVRAAPSKEPEYLEKSPMGKIPFLEVEGRYIFESAVIAEFLEQAYPRPALMPSDPFAAARVRELIALTDLHLEPPARSQFAVFFGNEEPNQRDIALVREKATLAAEGIGRRAAFAPFVAGADYTLADATLIVTLPWVRELVQKLAGSDPFSNVTGVEDWVTLMRRRPATQKMERGRKAAWRMQNMGRS